MTRIEEPSESQFTQEVPTWARRTAEIASGTLFIAAGLGVSYISYITMRNAIPILSPDDPQVLLSLGEAVVGGGILSIGIGRISGFFG